jgi:hypothetical protein
MDDTPRRRPFPPLLVLVLGLVAGFLLRGLFKSLPPTYPPTQATPTNTPGMGGGATATPTPNLNSTPTPTPTCNVTPPRTPGAQVVRIGPGACDAKPYCFTINAKTDTVVWDYTSSRYTPQEMWIEFPVSPFPVTLQGPHGGRVACAGLRCTSGQVVSPNPTPAPGTTRDYEYWQTLKDGPQEISCDGKIIIRW